MTRCNHCGANNMDGSEYCDECGTKLTPAEAPLPRQSSAPPEQFITQVAPPPPPSFTKDNVTPKPATPYTPPPPPSRPSSGDSADRPPGRGADRARDQSSNRASDSALNPASSSAPPAASQAANFQPPRISRRRARTELRAAVNRRIRPAPSTGRPTRCAAAGRRGRKASSFERREKPPGVGAKLIIQRGGKVGKEFPINGIEAMIGRWDADGGIFPDVDLIRTIPKPRSRAVTPNTVFE